MRDHLIVIVLHLYKIGILWNNFKKKNMNNTTFSETAGCILNYSKCIIKVKSRERSRKQIQLFLNRNQRNCDAIENTCVSKSSETNFKFF